MRVVMPLLHDSEEELRSHVNGDSSSVTMVGVRSRIGRWRAQSRSHPGLAAVRPRSRGSSVRCRIPVWRHGAGPFRFRHCLGQRRKRNGRPPGSVRPVRSKSEESVQAVVRIRIE